MVDLTAVAGALSSIKVASDIAKTMVDIADTAKFQEKAIELRAAILSAQESALAAKQDQAALLDEISELKKALSEIEDWKAERDRYELVQFPSGSFAYRFKPDANSIEPAHCTCANCYQKGQKSILHEMSGSSQGVMHCQSCKETIVQYPRGSSPSYGRLTRG